MTGIVELDQDGTTLLIRFSYREDLVAEVKELPGRRWDPKNKVWRIPAVHAEQVYARLVRHMFDFAPEIMSLIAGTLRLPPAKPPKVKADPQTTGSEAANSSSATDALSISALNFRVRDALRGQFTEPVWVIGEVVDFDKNQGKKHLFFNLVEKARGEARPRAAVEVALFERAAGPLLRRLASGADPFTLRDGIEIRAKVTVDLYVQSGRFQVVIEDIDPSFTLGKMALTREQLLRELRDKGLAGRNLALPLAVPPLRLGVLASPDSDGWNDFRRHLEESGCGFDVTLVPVKVQGIELKPSMLLGLDWFAEHAARFDALCILRGGGSRTDLAWFDDRDLAFAVARHPLKILVGIGHQRDQSVLDAIAHSEKTPTAVAEFLVRHVEEARRSVTQQARRLVAIAAEALASQRELLADHARNLARAVGARLVDERAFLQTARFAMQRDALRLLRDARHHGARAARELHSVALLQLQRAGAELRADGEQLRHVAGRRLEHAQHRLESAVSRLRLLDPRRVLGRGYALVRSEAGAVLPSVHRIQKGQALVIQLRDGSVRGRAEQVSIDG